MDSAPDFKLSPSFLPSMQLPSKIKQVKIYLHAQSIKGEFVRFSLFLILYFLGRYLLFIFETTTIGQYFLSPLQELLSYLITSVCCAALSWIYPTIHTSLNHTIYIANDSPIQMLPGCTGLSQMLRLSFVLLFYPISWRQKNYLFIPSILIILFAATIHFLILIPISYQAPEWYKFSHDYFTKIIFFGFIFLCWIIWEKAKGNESKPAL